MLAPASGSAAAKPPPAANVPTDALTEAQKATQASPDGQRNVRNAQILQASLQVSLQSGNDGLALLYRTAIDSINAELEPELGPDAIGQAMQQDNSPEATAGRIVSMSTAFFDAYAAQHADKDPQATARDFVALIRGGFEQGYAEAEKILKGLGVLDEGSPIAAGIAKTFELVQKGYDDFLNTKLAALQGEATAQPASAADKTA